MKQKRELWVDTAKGLGIIAVVIGHSGNEIAHHYLFWFHMPLFFILSGYTFIAHANHNDFMIWFKKRAKQLLIPYISFALSIAAIDFMIGIINGNTSVMSLIKDCIKVIYGGQILMGNYGVFWFITCLFVTQVMFALIVMYFKNIKTQLAIIAAAYVLAHLESNILIDHNIPIPWNADVMLLSIVYYAFGFYAHKISLNAIKRNMMAIASIIISIGFIICDYFELLTYELDLKKHIYNNLILDLLIPVSLTITVCVISYSVSKLSISKIFITLGTLSLSIMYLHIPLNTIGRYLTFDYGIFVFTFIGITIPVLINVFLLDKFYITKFLFLGRSSKNNFINDQLNKKIV